MDINAFDLAIAAFVLPPVIAFLNQRRWSAPVKGFAALAVCAVYAFAILLIRDGLDFTRWRDTLLTVAGSAFAAYKLWWQPSGIAPAIEATTSLDAPRTPGSSANPYTPQS